MTFSNTTLSIMARIAYIGCHYAECHNDVHYAECHYVERRYAECLGADKIATKTDKYS
jgi:hypothetical protein